MIFSNLCRILHEIRGNSSIRSRYSFGKPNLPRRVSCPFEVFDFRERCGEDEDLGRFRTREEELARNDRYFSSSPSTSRESPNSISIVCIFRNKLFK